MTTRIEQQIVQQIEEGNIYDASARIELGAGATESFVIKAPADVDVKPSILAFTITNEATLSLDFYEGVTIDSNGTSMEVANSKSGASNSTDIVFEYGGSYSGGSKVAEDLFAAGTKNQSSGAKTNDIRRIVSSGDAVRYEFTNEDGSNSQLIGLKIIFFEKPES